MDDHKKILAVLHEKLSEFEEAGDELKFHNLSKDIEGLQSYIDGQNPDLPNLEKWGVEQLVSRVDEKKDGSGVVTTEDEGEGDNPHIAELEDETHSNAKKLENEKSLLSYQDLVLGSGGNLNDIYQRLMGQLRNSATDDADINRAIEKCSSILSSVDMLNDKEIDQWNTLRDQFNIERTRRRNKYYEAGVSAREAGDLDGARENFSKIIALNLNDKEAREQLVELNKSVADSISEAEIRILENKLKSENNLNVLTKAIQEAEALYQQGKLSENLIQEYFSAIELRDKIRARHGIVTTKARIGNLQDAYDAVFEVEEAIKGGQAYWYDESGENIPIAKYLERVNLLWQDRSLVFYNDTEIAVKNNLDSHQPDVALNIYKNRRLVKGTDKEQPIHESHKDLWAKLEQTILSEKEKQDQANQLILESEQASDTISGYKKLCNAKAIFPYIQSLDERMDDARAGALAYLLPQFNNIKNAIEGNIESFNFEDIENQVTKAASLQSSWPESTIPNEIISQVDEIIKLAGVGQQRAEEYRQFTEKLKNLNELIEANELEQGKQAIADLENHAEFGQPKYQIRYENIKRNLLSRMAREANVAARINMAEEAKVLVDWKAIVEICQGEKDETLKKYYDEARYHIWVAELDECLNEQNIDEAQSHYQSLIQNYPDSIDALTSQKQMIDMAVSNTTDELRNHYSHALKLKKSRQITERIGALNIFQHIAGLDRYDEEYNEESSAVEVTSLTHPARLEMEALQKTLRNEYLQRIIEGAARSENLGVHEKENLANIAQELRVANLLWTDEEKQASKLIEVGYKLHITEALKGSNNWGEIIKILEEVDRHYPLTPNVKSKLREARLQFVFQSAHTAIGEGELEEGLATLREAQNNESLRNSAELRFEIIHFYDLMERYDTALMSLEAFNSPEYDEEVKKKANLLRAEFQNKAIVQNTYLECSATLSALKENECWALPENFSDKRDELPRETIADILLNLKKTQKDHPSTKLNELFSEVFFEEENFLLSEEKLYLSQGAPEMKYKALLSMIDLERIEEMKEGESLSGVAKGKIEEIIEDIDSWSFRLLAPSRQYLPDSGNAPVELHAMIQNLKAEREKLQVIQKYVGDQRIAAQLAARITALANVEFELNTLESDEEIKKFVVNNSLNENWEEAISTNDFSRLERIKQRLESARIPDILEIEAFYQRLIECRNLTTYFHNGIREIKNLYMPQNGEHYDQIVESIKTIRLFQGYPKFEHLQLIDENDYKNIVVWLDSRMTVRTTQIKLNGWDNVLADAQERRENYQIWKNWLASVEEEYEPAWAFQNFVESCIVNKLPWINEEQRQKLDLVTEKGLLPDYFSWFDYLFMPGFTDYLVQNPNMAKFKFQVSQNSVLPLTFQKWAWLENYRYVMKALLFISAGPTGDPQEVILQVDDYLVSILGLYHHIFNDEQAYLLAKRRTVSVDENEKLEVFMTTSEGLDKFEALSEKATKIKDKCIDLRNDLNDKAIKTISKLKGIQKSIDGYGGFPLPADGKRAISNPIDLKSNVIDRAYIIGAAMPDEARDLMFWENKYESLQTDKKRKTRSK